MTKVFTKSLICVSIILMAIALYQRYFFTYALELYGEKENLHINEVIEYPSSAINAKVLDVFSEENLGEGAPKHYVGLLADGYDALLARIHLIRQAKKIILLQTFLWAHDEVGKILAYEINEAAKRGVKVRILIDYPSVQRYEKLMAYFLFSQDDLKVKTYNPFVRKINAQKRYPFRHLFIHSRKIAGRMHNQLLIIDDQIAIAGSRNIKNEYFGLGEKLNFKDREALILGPVVSDMTDSFMKYWSFKLCIPLGDIESVAKKARIREWLGVLKREDIYQHEYLREIDSKASDKNALLIRLKSRLFEVIDIAFIADEPWPHLTRPRPEERLTDNAFHKLLSETRNYITLEVPYLVFDDQELRILKKIKRRRKSIGADIATNSLASTDNLMAYALSFKAIDVILKDMQFEVFAIRPNLSDLNKWLPSQERLVGLDIAKSKTSENLSDILYIKNPMSHDGRYLSIHSKTMVVDSSVVWMGPFVLGGKEKYYHSESALIVRDADFAEYVEDNIDDLIEPYNSWALGKSDIPRPWGRTQFNKTLFNKGYLFADWPYRDISSYELIDGKAETPFYSAEFRSHYREVGEFPLVKKENDLIHDELIKAIKKWRVNKI